MTTAAINAGFDLDLKDILPRLRIYALSLTRNKDRADDLVQQTALKALAGRASFHVGSNFGGWIFRIQRNEFISELRRNRPTVELDSPEAYAVQEQPRQEHQLILRDVLGALRQLPRHGRQALLQSQIEGCSHREIASRAGISIGTVKSRISRGRTALARLLDLPRLSAATARPVLQTVNA
ncbi:MAG TPA: sigma-70 family RNA polymerase sigma factor [Acetobacteraceae bacterium]|jgi:RNA polymerase sigma-70 factor (ECF subfamily)|nr:sigma-70 family RNA polymerase sigma factor [Acetobacteraceae bacterium]